jgi:hypothetical protein
LTSSPPFSVNDSTIFSDFLHPFFWANFQHLLIPALFFWGGTLEIDQRLKISELPNMPV